MKVIKNESVKYPFKNNEPMFCFGGNACSIEIPQIDTIEALYWYPSEESSESIPVLFITLKNGAKISIDYTTEEDAREALKAFMKHKIRILGK